MSSSRKRIDPSAERRSAPRVPIRTRVRYREPGDGDWIEGLTENISRSGILFRGQPIGEPRGFVGNAPLMRGVNLARRDVVMFHLLPPLHRL